VPPARLAILHAEERRASTPADLLTLRSAIRSPDPLTAILAIRAVGRLERPALVVDLIPALSSVLPEVRTEAANAIGQAAQGGPGAGRLPAGVDVGSIFSTLTGALGDEDVPGVRAAVYETIGRLPYQTSDQVAQAESVLLDHADRVETVADRLGIAKGLEALIRRQRDRHTASPRSLAALRHLAGVDDDVDTASANRLRDSRVRRLALEAILVVAAIDDGLVLHAATDPDPQVRRLAMRAAAISGRGTGVLARGLEDPAAMVRLEALRGFASRGDDGACETFIAATLDVETTIALTAIDQMAVCGQHAATVALLAAATRDLSRASAARGWHRSAHAIVALAAAAPEQAADALDPFVASQRWQMRVYAARAAAALKNRSVLQTLAADAHDNVVEAAIAGLAAAVGHESDALYIRTLSRSGYPAVRAAATALDGTPHAADALPALKAAWTRLTEENSANSSDARAAISATMTRLGTPPPAVTPPRRDAQESKLTAAELRRLAAPRARITIRDLGSFDLALFTSEAPATVVRFATLAESGYYDGLTFHRVVPNFVVQGGSSGAHEFDFIRDEVGLWPHVRGAVGMSTRGRDTGDGQFFVNLVDNPRFDHEYTVFAQILNGIDVVERILEGDVIERIEIVP
jgi:cyclophilin family peptidyl-prolyl cis-trans isomerase